MLDLPAKPRRIIPFCERYFGPFFLLWGLLLIADSLFTFQRYGLFYGRMQDYLPGWIWGGLLFTTGAARILATLLRITWLRIALSIATLIILTVIASISLYSGLWAATAPLASFVAIIAYWCHGALLRDLRHGL